MSIANLHSILSGRWFIHKEYGHALLPSLFSILNGKDMKVEAKDRKPEEFIHTRTGVFAAVNGNNSSEADYVLVTNLKNAIYKYDQECGPQGTKSKMKTLDYYKNDSNCKGIVLDIDSGGGQVSGTPEFHDYLLNFPKPIVAYTDGMMCSAAYYIGSASSHIFANKRADHIGSIGTMIHFIDFTGYYEKEGAKVITEYATKSTEKNLPFEELLKGNSKLIVEMELDPINEQFHEDVKTSRPGISEDVFAGATYNADVALEKGLVDSIGNLQDAINKVFELSKSSNTNQNNNSMSQKSLPLVEAALGLDAPLAVTENGSYLNVAQLDQLEQVLADAGTEKDRLTNELATANSNHTSALTAAQEARQTAENLLGTLEASLLAVLDAAGLEAQETAEANIAALQAYAEEKGGEAGANPTKTRTSADADATNLGVGGIDVEAYLNN